MDLSIVIPVYNNFKLTESCLKDLSFLNSNHEIIVVDNGSSDETISLKENTRIKYIRLNNNLGFAKACNEGYKLSASNNVLFLNNDIKVLKEHDSWTKPLIEWSSDYICGPTFGMLDKSLNFVKESNCELKGDYNYISGWCLCSSKKVFSRLLHLDNRLFCEDFFVYFEDTDLSFRAKKAGLKFKHVNVPVIHFGKQTSSKLNTSKLYNESRSIFVQKWKK
jgi:GT2 family glycosyltransferase